ncbi:TonB-dependent receptor domain-containing protein [Pseudomonas phoenicis]|uniref:TonB-dependent receptor domain-containing protein n=1 Tax=unclassified Pseudomonas TaxID=196821 RepID=UPI00399FECEE
MKHPALPLSLLTAAFLATPSLQAAPMDEPSPGNATELEASFVTANGAGPNVRDAPASVSVITREEIERQPVHDLGTLLRRLPGVSGGFGPVGEQSKIKLRGLDDQYTVILVDGKRVGNSADTHYRRDLARQDLNWISPNMIERIEVTRGPMSSRYGADAMGGVINIVTRKVSRTWDGSLSVNATVPQHADRGRTEQTGFNLSGPLTDTLGLRLGANLTRRASDEVQPRSNAQGAPLRDDGAGGAKDHHLNALLDWRVSEAHSLSLEVAQGVERSWGSKEPGSQVKGFGAGHLTRDSYIVSYQGDLAFGTAQLDAYVNRFENRIDREATDAEEQIIEGHVSMPFEWPLSHRMTVGGQWKRDALNNPRTLGAVPIDPEGRPVSGSTSQGKSWAAFVEEELFLLDNLSLTLGNRFDHNDHEGNHNSPRAYLVYHPHPDWTLRGGLARGLRAPTIKERSAGAATRSNGNGCTSLRPLGYVSGGCWMAGNPDLRSETSLNKEIGVAYDSDGWEAGLTYFHTDFENKIEYAPIGQREGRWWTRLENVEKARTRGWESTVRVPIIADRVVWRSNATYLLESRNLATGEALISAPELSLYSAIEWQINDRVDTQLAAQHVGRQRGVATKFIKPYTTYDVTTQWVATDALRLNAGILNLLDEQARDGSTQFYVPGRAFYVGMTTYF